ncbi:MAG TPA: DUF1553 domain-containing protein [Bryobacteraceae bacterium]|nr:DUF1553 domain-containing protein [Bryobacteraceae bacterium]
MAAWRAFALLLGVFPLLAQEDGAAFFEKNIRPILVKQCLSCHSAESQPVMGALRLDSREAALKGGSRGPSIVPGNVGESLLMKAVRHTAGALKMPPGPKMKDTDTALIAKWIQMGAPWGSDVTSKFGGEKFWAFVPPREPAIPAVNDKAWVRSAIDSFVLNALEFKGLNPTRQADKRTLIRRASYDLTGLPPTITEVSDFLADESPDAFSRVVERLLASPRYGERWGRHWLDVARYADSNGLDENLVYKNAYRYRDYVIAAFNKDKPFDQFLHEQLAGDLLPQGGDEQARYERLTATGFLSLGAKMLAEDDPVKMEMDIVDEQLDTTARAFMGLTVGCARCHDHKFDPISHADYYALAGIFKSSKTMENFKVVAKWHEHVLAPKEDRDKLIAHEAKVEAKRKEIGKITSANNEKLASEGINRMGAYLLAAAHVQRDQQIQVSPVESATNAVVLQAGSFSAGNIQRLLEKKKSNVPKDKQGPFFAEYEVTAPATGDYQIDIFDEEKGSGTADLWVNGVWVRQGSGPVQNRAASSDAGGWSYLAIVPLKQGWNTIRLEHATRFPYFEKLLVAPNSTDRRPLTTVQIANRYEVNPTYLNQLVEYLERSNGAIASVLHEWEIQGKDGALAESPEALAAKYETLFQHAAREGKDASDAKVKAVYGFITEKFGPFRAPANFRRYYPAETREELARLDAELKMLETATPKYPQAMGVTENATIGDLAIHLRGSHWTLGEKVPRRFLKVISGEQSSIPATESGRLQLARWMTQKDHPLTSRVMVNRIWRGHFGRGIVPSVDNFGRLGEKPANQPLLDWLALRFVENGWSIKAMHRMVMLSNTYQMSSEYNAKASDIDPENVLLWRMPRRRLEAEAIRDGIMSVSGGLNTEGGGSLLPYKDREYVADTARGGTVDYDRPIRAVYIPVVRSSMYDVFTAFDLPDPSSSNGDRDSTVVAPQALFMMNSSVMLKHSRKMAEGLLARDDLDDAGRIREAYQRALTRPATPVEIDNALSFISRIGREWQGAKTNAWQSFCKALLSSSEFIYVN